MREIRARFRAQKGLATSKELRALGVTKSMQSGRLAAGEWERAAPGVIRLAGAPQTPDQDLLAVCLSAGQAAVARGTQGAFVAVDWGTSSFRGWLMSASGEVPTRAPSDAPITAASHFAESRRRSSAELQ